MIHRSVLRDRCVALLTPSIEKSADPIVVDATLGMGGHSEALLESFANLRIVGLDRDKEALAIASHRLERWSDRIDVVHAVYDQIPEVLSELGINGVDGILFDLGVSSLQLDELERGFSYAHSAPLDMRMDKSAGLTAADVLETYEKSQLIRILKVYGEEKFANRIAENIIKARAVGGLKSTTDLAELVKASIPAPARRIGGNPAKRTFQAIRIEVNQELEILQRALPKALNAIKVGGRVVVMSFQSLEDRIVKEVFQEASESKSPRELPIEIESLKAKFELVFRGSEKASAKEIEENSRAQSVRLRAIERVAS
ncbi:MAG: 16S rRNA (cytosine(1402)-N(4))-methyltransferase RsmH [Actinobacteria bacterium]|nr:16S rRNA (cytosine(1402)-N(4))-methyltransferase RsmH [Actinomycetota bacterium]NDE83258.1 16S rRNA (cytosine(1402)-N(4))-methyltransferase RsmH [Actinomycetota bacterium]